MYILFYLNLTLAGFNLARGLGRLILGVPDAWIPLVLGAGCALTAWGVWRNMQGNECSRP